MAHRLEQIEVLHVSGADLNDVHILEQGQLGDVHQLGDNGQAGFRPGGLEILQAGFPQALEGVRGGTGLEGASPEHGGAAGLHRPGDGHHLFLALHRAGAGHDGQAPAADPGVPHRNHRILGVELPVGVLIRLLDPLHILHDVQSGDQVDVQLGGVAHQAQDGVGLANAGVDGDPLLLEPVDQTLQLLRVVVAL